MQSMTATAHRRPITTHPAFAPLIALWLAALFGLTVAVLPAPVVERALAAVGMADITPLSLPGRIVVSALTAALGALAGYALARAIAGAIGADPRPVFRDVEHEFDEAVAGAPARRPLHVREELADGFGDESQVMPPQPAPFEPAAARDEGFMILTPQPIHPPLPAPDLDALLAQFDSAFAAFRDDEDARSQTAIIRPGADPVQTFVAQQTGAPAPTVAASPMGGLVPDHQAELRAALDKLARSQGKS